MHALYIRPPNQDKQNQNMSYDLHYADELPWSSVSSCLPATAQ
jgi:hypothetical protein